MDPFRWVHWWCWLRTRHVKCRLHVYPSVRFGVITWRIDGTEDTKPRVRLYGSFDYIIYIKIDNTDDVGAEHEVVNAWRIGSTLVQMKTYCPSTMPFTLAVSMTSRTKTSLPHSSTTDAHATSTIGPEPALGESVKAWRSLAHGPEQKEPLYNTAVFCHLHFIYCKMSPFSLSSDANCYDKMRLRLVRAGAAP